MKSIEPELWVDRASEAVLFYETAFGARTLHRVGEGENVVAQLAVGDARFWVASADSKAGRFSPKDIAGRTGRNLLIVDEPDVALARATGAGATEASLIKNTGGSSAGSSIRTVTNGRSASPWAFGLPLRKRPFGGRPSSKMGRSSSATPRPVAGNDAWL